MAYATDAEFVAAVGELEAKALAPATPPAQGYDAALIGEKLDDASAVLDTYLATRFPTPVEPAPRTARMAVIAWAREALDRQVRPQVKADADRWRSWARDVAKGLASIGGGTPGADAPAETSSGGPAVAESPATFGPDQLAGFMPGMGA